MLRIVILCTLILLSGCAEVRDAYRLGQPVVDVPERE